jgi:hypothetical protein
VRLGFVGHERREHSCEPDRLATQVAPHRRPVPGVEDEVDRREDDAQPLRHEVLGRHAQRDACVPDLPLRAHEPLGERRLGDEEGPRDLGRRQAADEAQRQRDLRFRRERRVAAGEDQLEPLVGNGRLLVVGELRRAGEQLRLARERLLAPDAVDRAVAGVATIQAPGLRGTPSRGHRSAARTKASCTASSARSRSPRTRPRIAIERARSSR